MVLELAFEERFPKFTPSAVATLTLAEEEARRQQQGYIATEHLLAGMLRQGAGLACIILANIGVDLQQLEAGLAAIIPKVARSDTHVLADATPGLSPLSRRVIALSVEEARRLGHQYIGQEHLLLGFLQEGDGVAARVLLEYGVTSDRVRTEVERLAALLKPGVPGASPKNNVVSCRLTDDDVQALDDLVEAGIRSTRSDAAAWLIHVGLETNAQLLETVRGTVAEIRQLRLQAQAMAQQLTHDTRGPTDAAETPPTTPS